VSQPLAAKPGQLLTLPFRIPPTQPDRRLLTFTVYLLPHGANTSDHDRALSQSATLRLAPAQQRISPVLQIPATLAPGTYDLFGYATWPGPSLCLGANPAGSTQIGMEWGGVGRIAVK
jgi:hypothetical protein